MKWTVLTIWVLSESCGDPSDSPAPATYRMLGFSLDAITNLQRKERRRSRRARITKKKQRHGCEGGERDGWKVAEDVEGWGDEREEEEGKKGGVWQVKAGLRREMMRNGTAAAAAGSGTPRSCRTLSRANSGKDGGMNYWSTEKSSGFLAGGGCLSLFCWKFPTCINKVWLSQLINLPSSFHGRLSADRATDTVHTALLFLGSSLGLPVSER